MARLREPAVNGVEHEPTATVPLDVQEFDRLRSEPAPWSTPTVEEAPWDTLLTELANGGAQLEEAYRAATEKQPDAVADVPDRAEVRAAADPVPSHRQPAETPRTPAPVTEQDCAVCGGDLYRCFPLRCPLRTASRERLHSARSPKPARAAAPRNRKKGASR